eukprot:11385667-Alexandrium_andersonii.AAC.1
MAILAGSIALTGVQPAFASTVLRDMGLLAEQGLANTNLRLRVLAESAGRPGWLAKVWFNQPAAGQKA